MEYFFSGFEIVLHWSYIGYMFAGVFWGMLVGFLPGLQGGTAIALMIPLSYDMETLPALVFLLSVYTGSIFGGAVTAILFNTPGSAANIATAYDGYPMARNGEPDRALGIALMSSFLGGIIGCVALLTLAQPMAMFALRFGPGEMFAVVIFGLSVVGSLSSDMLKSLFAGFLGLLLGTVGTNLTGVTRGTFGSAYLFDGIPLVPAFLGFLALPEICRQIAKPLQITGDIGGKRNMQALLKGMGETARHAGRALVCSVGGVIVGIIPAAGAAIASMLCYNQSKQLSRRPQRYGTGIPEGIVASETANNASEGGALTTMFVLGIPGSGATALLLGALVLQGWIPGPKLFFEHGEIIYASISSLFVQQFAMLFLGVILCLVGSKIARLPFSYLMPCIVLFTIIGAYSERNALFDAGLMVFFCGLGLLMEYCSYPIAPLILGLMLGGMADTHFVRIHQSYANIWSIFKSPITCALFAATLFSLAFPYINARRRGW